MNKYIFRAQLNFEIIKRGWLKQKWYFRVLSSNGKVLAVSEGYYNQKDCEDVVMLIKNHSESAPINFVQHEK